MWLAQAALRRSTFCGLKETLTLPVGSRYYYYYYYYYYYLRVIRHCDHPMGFLLLPFRRSPPLVLAPFLFFLSLRVWALGRASPGGVGGLGPS